MLMVTSGPQLHHDASRDLWAIGEDTELKEHDLQGRGPRVRPGPVVVVTRRALCDREGMSCARLSGPREEM